MANPQHDRSTQTSLLLSLILHVVMALVLAFVLIDRSQEQAAESLEVAMISATERVTPPRRMERLEAWRNTPDSPNPSKDRAKAQFEIRRLDQADVDFTSQSRSSDATAILPELETRANRLKSKFDMPLPSATGANIAKPGTGATRGVGSSRAKAGSIGLSPAAGMFETALYWIARNTADRNTTGKEDVVFLVDASGTMKDNINAVARYISKMIDVLEESELDYTMGVIRFSRDTLLKKNDIKVYEQTTDADEIRAILKSINCIGDERTLDAIEVGLTQVEFRHPVDKTFILVTDEGLTPRTVTRQTRKDLTYREMMEEDFRWTLKACQDNSVKVNVLGMDDEMHKSIAKETGGLWFQVPQQ